ncbi:hypothetical protein E6W36_03745 [Hankyongella ginsenosidimutans]|uniref:Uncharacterized protein n=1 Tax=Hankyongella ginsenosidimutans TaxID=1763828 RepID=A0A4D7BZZ1_9SPHN|nr:hypothetical protein [Hankyongella ginsenosidimutans]QCI79014.1 hypothetical protein E6W36_03745 [Hankyongella ginsenosidimutans]
MIARYLCAGLAVGALSFSQVFAQDAPESLLPAQRPASEVAPTPLPGVSQPAPEDTATDATPLPAQVERPNPGRGVRRRGRVCRSAGWSLQTAGWARISGAARTRRR